jgi:TfoX/Sxy family transcriptional regulator of competence genes
MAMATDASFVAYVSDQAGLGTRLTSKRMFGEYALYVDGKVVAFACDNQVFVKPTPAGRALLPQAREGKPYPPAKPHLLMCDELEDRLLWQRVLLATADALPAPAPRKRVAKQAATRATR